MILILFALLFSDIAFAEGSHSISQKKDSEPLVSNLPAEKQISCASSVSENKPMIEKESRQTERRPVKVLKQRDLMPPNYDQPRYSSEFLSNTLKAHFDQIEQYACSQDSFSISNLASKINDLRDTVRDKTH